VKIGGFFYFVVISVEVMLLRSGKSLAAIKSVYLYIACV
jgi:hypothetical protein